MKKAMYVSILFIVFSNEWFSNSLPVSNWILPFYKGQKHVDFKWQTEKKFLSFLDLLVMRKQKENSVASRGSNFTEKFICITTPFEVSELLV